MTSHTWRKPKHMSYDETVDWLERLPFDIFTQQKIDGMFVRISHSPEEGLVSHNRGNTKEWPIPQPVQDAYNVGLLPTDHSWQIVGEAIGGGGHWHTFVIFDIEEFEGKDLQVDFIERWAVLESNFSEVEATTFVTRNLHRGLFLLRPVGGAVESLALLHDLRETVPPYEGVVIHQSGVSTPHRCVNVFECDVVITKITVTHNSKLGGSAKMNLVREDGSYLGVGNLSLALQDQLGQIDEGKLFPRNDKDELIDPVVMRVGFHGARTISTTLVQPRFVEVRQDKTPAECDVYQLDHWYGSRFR